MAKKIVGAQAVSQKRTQAAASKRMPANLDEEIKAKAFEYFTRRASLNEPGDEMSDWLKAESDVKRKHGLA
jgi:hypothetical protein